MTVTRPLGEIALPVDAATLAALHRRACVLCGAAGVPLVDAGFLRTIGSGGTRLGWPVAACLTHGTDTPESTP